MKKNILITGVAGFIASKIAEKFKKDKFNIIGIDDLSGGDKKNIPQGIQFIKGDLANKKTFKSGYKKAIVTLKKGQSIDLATGI